ncbi:MAG: ABC transporter permease subunit [Lachnospiraceae bacterium]|nr:ABC transporter permease subunit [Lachnospiraceae bacterium]
MLAVYKRELQSYVTSMTGFVCVAFFLVIAGVYFFVNNLDALYSNFEYTLSAISFVYIIMVPLMTMRILAEERKQKTDQLLLTAPVSVEKVIISKYLAVFTVFFAGMAVLLFYPLILTRYGTVDLGQTYGAWLAFLLMGAAYLAIGMFISSLTESQMISAVVTFLVLLLMFFMGDLAGKLPTAPQQQWLMFSGILWVGCFVLWILIRNVYPPIFVGCIGEIALTLLYRYYPIFYENRLAGVIRWFSLSSRFTDFVNGIFHVSSVFYYFSVICLFVFLTVQVVKRRRWV